MRNHKRHWRHRRNSVRRPSAVSHPPGTVDPDPSSNPTIVRVLAYSPTKLLDETLTDLKKLPAIIGEYDVTWIDIDGLQNADIIQTIGKMLSLHPLALEDVVHTHQRAKTDVYDDVTFVVARMVQGPPLISEQASLFLGTNFVVTFQEDVAGDNWDAVRSRLRNPLSRLRRHKADYLAYELIDSVIDGYFPLLERFGSLLDQIDDRLGNESPQVLLGEIHELRANLLYLRRIIWPHREMLLGLTRGSDANVFADTQVYLRDSYDHTAQIIDLLEVYRESCSDLRDFLYSLLSNRTNEIMRTLTLITTAFMPITFLAGLYGMNFHEMPELRWKYGYPAVLILMVVSVVSFAVFFARKGWLRSSDLTSLRQRKTADPNLPDSSSHERGLQ